MVSPATFKLFLLSSPLLLTRPLRSKKIPEWGMEGLNAGDDIAGTVHAVGSNVIEFRRGDRVASFMP